MANANDAFPSAYLKADDFINGPQTFTISEVKMRFEFNDGSIKQLVTFRPRADEREGKKLVCNKTNWSLLKEMLGLETDDWIGKPVTLQRQMVDFKGDRVPSVRVVPVSMNGHSAPAAPAAPAVDGRRAAATALKLWTAKAKRVGGAEPDPAELAAKADELAALCYGAGVVDSVVDKFLTAPDAPQMLQAMWDAFEPLLSRLSGNDIDI